MNLELYDKLKSVPENAQKQIIGGRLKGMTDINPMWRFKALTQEFGVCGFGWKYEITKKEIIEGGNGEKSAFVDINLYVKIKEKWSDAICGTGGSSFIANERNGLYTNDECFKMALTDAISVACKALGMGADVYWNKDTTKYTAIPQRVNKDQTKSPTWLNVTDYNTGAINETGRKIKEELASGKTAQEIIEMAEKKYKLSAKVKGLIEQWGKEATEEEPFDDNQFEEITKDIK